MSNSSNNIKGYLAIFALFIAFSFVFYMGCGYMQPQPDLDGDTFCPADTSTISAINVVLIDRTEKFTEIQQEDIIKSFMYMIQSSSKNEKFILYEILGRENLAIKSETEICNPGGQSDDLLAKQRYDEMFITKLENIFKNNMTIRGQQDSPIMEMIQAVAVVNFKHAPATANKKLFLVSDMMQYSSGYSQYTGRLNSREFYKSSFYKSVEVPLSGVDVQVHYVSRFSGSSAQPKQHQEFWNEYFNHLHAKSVAFEMVNGSSWDTHLVEAENE